MSRIIRLVKILGAALVLFGLPIVSLTPVRAVEGEFIRPIHGATTLRFGAKYIDAAGKTRGHHGIDIDAGEGTAVKASSSGKVVFAGSTPNGICVSIIHAGAIKTTYLPLSSAKVSRGDMVGIGQTIGYVGPLGDPSGKTPHLHMGAIFAGEYIDPESLFRGEFHSDLSKIIRRADIPPAGTSGHVMAPALTAAAVVPGFLGWLSGKTQMFIDWLFSGGKWLWSLSANSASYIWEKTTYGAKNLFKWIGARFNQKGYGTWVTFPAPGIRLGSAPVCGTRTFDPSGDASVLSNIIEISCGSSDLRDVLVFDSKGREVRRFVNWEAENGFVSWDGLDNRGRIVSSGIYTVIVEYAGSTEGFLAEAKWHS